MTHPETNQREGPSFNQIAEDIKKQIKEADTDDKQKELKKRLKEKFEKADTSAIEYVTNWQRGINSAPEGNKVKSSLLELAIAVKEGVDVSVGKEAKILLIGLAKDSVSPAIASSIRLYLGDYLLGEKKISISQPGEEKSEFENAFNSLRSENPAAANLILKTLINNADKFGLKEEEITEKFKIERSMNDRSTEEMWRNDLLNLYQSRFSDEQLTFLKRLYHPEEFVNYIKERVAANTKEDVEKKERIKEMIEETYLDVTGSRLSPKDLKREVESEYRQHISESISLELTGIINQLYIDLQRDRAHKPAEEVAREDFMHGIDPTKQRILNVISSLELAVKGMEDRGEDVPKLFKNFEEEQYIDERLDEEGRQIVDLRLVPLTRPKEVPLGRYLETLGVMFKHSVNSGDFFHNVRFLYNNPGGKEGFWGQMSGFAEKLQTTDIDDILLAPDGSLTLEAFHLYDKFVQEEFAVQDWRHRPNQFTNKLEEFNTQTEERIIQYLKKMYPDYKESRLRNAVNRGVGLAEGVFLTMPEMMAYADPVNEKGEGLYSSYGTNDASPMVALNPLHVIMRWQGEHLLSLFYFLPIDESGHRDLKFYRNHKDLFKRMKKYQESYFKGEKTLEEVKGLMIDHLINFNKGGGIFTRGGWRTQYVDKNHLIYFREDSDGPLKWKIDFLKSWKIFEQIGYEGLKEFIGNISKDEVFSASDAGSKKDRVLIKEREKFFRYIFDKFYKPCFPENVKNSITFESYWESLMKEGKKKAEDYIKENHTLSQGSFEDQIVHETSSLFFGGILPRLTALRMPSKILRMTRKRFSKDGVSRWNFVQEKMGLSRDEFHVLMQDISFAEIVMRKEASQLIKDRLRLFPNEMVKCFSNLDSSLTELTPENLKRILEDNFKDLGTGSLSKENKKRIEIAVNTLEIIRKEYIEKKGFFKEFQREIKRYPFTFGIEQTDISLLAFRGAGPRIIARSIGDTALLEKDIMGPLLDFQKVLGKISVDGKEDFGPVLEYFTKVRHAMEMVHGPIPAAEKIYELSVMVIEYFAKDTKARALGGVFGVGGLNSMAAEYSGRNIGTWQWDSRDINNFIIALEKLRLLPKNPYDLGREARYKDIWLINPITKKPFKIPFFKRRVVDYKYNAKKLRRAHGGGWWDIGFDMLNKYLPIIIVLFIWYYLKKALDEAEGKKK